MTTGRFDISWDPHFIFFTQKNPYIDFILQAKFEKVWIVRS